MAGPTMPGRELAACARLWRTLLARQRVGQWSPVTMAGVSLRGRAALPRVVTVGGRARVSLGAPIGEDGISARQFVAALDGITARNIDLCVDSPGGSVFDSFAMHLALRQHPARVVAHIDGQAFSGASIVAMAADEIRIARSARMQVHDLVPVVLPHPAVRRQFGAVLDELSDTIAQLYADRCGGTMASWRARMQVGDGAGTWFSAAQAVAVGLADILEDDQPTSIHQRSARRTLYPHRLGAVRRLAAA